MTSRHPIVDPPVNFRTKPVHQTVKVLNAGRSIAARLQCLDRPVDKVGGVTHGFGGFENDAWSDRRSAVSSYGVTRRWVRTAAW